MHIDFRQPTDRYLTGKVHWSLDEPYSNRISVATFDRTSSLRKDGKQQRFNLGPNRDEAERRRHRVQRLYAESVLVRENYGEAPSWTEAALYAARLIAAGQMQVTVPSPSRRRRSVWGSTNDRPVRPGMDGPRSVGRCGRTQFAADIIHPSVGFCRQEVPVRR